jgi:hypothetical protein
MFTKNSCFAEDETENQKLACNQRFLPPVFTSQFYSLDIEKARNQKSDFALRETYPSGFWSHMMRIHVSPSLECRALTNQLCCCIVETIEKTRSKLIYDIQQGERSHFNIQNLQH